MRLRLYIKKPFHTHTFIMIYCQQVSSLPQLLYDLGHCYRQNSNSYRISRSFDSFSVIANLSFLSSDFLLQDNSQTLSNGLIAIIDNKFSSSQLGNCTHSETISPIRNLISPTSKFQAGVASGSPSSPSLS